MALEVSSKRQSQSVGIFSLSGFYVCKNLLLENLLQEPTEWAAQPRGSRKHGMPASVDGRVVLQPMSILCACSVWCADRRKWNSLLSFVYAVHANWMPLYIEKQEAKVHKKMEVWRH
jgi:hypothetical protein